MAKVLVVYYSLSGNTKQMAEAVAQGAREVADTEVVLRTGIEATLDDLLECDGIAVGSPDYFSYMAGGLKDFFDRCYYPSQGKVTGKPAVAFGSAGGPPTTVLNCLEQAIRWFKFNKVAESVGASGSVAAGVLTECQALGRRLAEAAGGLTQGA